MKTPTILKVFTLVLVFAAPVYAHAQTWILEGTGPLPTLRSITPPPIVPPVTPPVVVPPVTPPAVDNTPFPFPASCPGENADPAARYFTLAVTQVGAIYAGQVNFGNPLPASHQCVGMAAGGARASYGSEVGGLMVWAPRGTPYGLLRCLLATGRPCS